MTQTKAIYCALAAFFGWVLVDTAIKLGAERDLPPALIMGVLGLAGVVGTVGSAMVRGAPALLRPVHWRGHIVVGLASALCNFATVIALKHLPITIFYIVVFTAPFVIAGLSVALKREVLTGKKIACLVAGFLGVVIAVGPRGAVAGEWIGYAAGLFSVFGFAVYTLTISKISHSDSSESILLTNATVSAVIGLACSLSAWEMVDVHGLAIMLFAGIANVASNALYNRALRHTTSTNVAQIHYSQIISGALLGYLFWREVPTWNLLFGAMLIMMSGLVVAAQARRDDI